MQKILIMSTEGNGELRAEAVGWSAEDGAELNWALCDSETSKKYNERNLPVGYIGTLKEHYCFQTPLHALGNGWKLMAPPSERMSDRWTKEKGLHGIKCQEWWFSKEF